MKKILTIFFSLSILLIPNALGAQSFEAVSLSANPENPSAGQTVRITAQSYSISIDQASVVWYANGKKILEGKGKKELVTKMPSSGNLLIQVNITDSNNKTSEQTILLQPVSLDLIYEAIDSYVPQFYKGKALVPEESVVKIIAMPNTVKALSDTDDTTYAWSRNNSNVPGASGYGKNVYTIKLDPFYNSEQVGVTATNNIGASTDQTIQITPTKSEVILYEVNPLYGIEYGKALMGTIPMTKNEITVDAEPFFFSPVNKVSDVLEYTWLLNGNLIESKSNKAQLTLQKSGDTAQTTTLEVDIKHTIRTLEQAFQQISLSFN